jgi:hypothetical protein
MGGLISKPKVPPPPPAPPPPPPVPTVDDAAMSSEAEDKVRRRKGRASTVLSQGSDLATAEPTTAATLLGA